MMFGLPGQGMHFRIGPLPAFFLFILIVQVLAHTLALPRRSIVFWVSALGAALAVLSADAFTLVFGLGLMIAAFCRAPIAMPSSIVLAGASAILHLMPGASLWWGVALIVLGGLLAFAGALRAMLEARMTSMLAWAMASGGGLVGVALGLAWRAQAMGDAALAALALKSALLFILAYGLFMPLLWLGAAAVGQATGTVSLDWLGGLMRGMPRLGMLMLAGAAGMGLVPFAPGFAPEFLLLHAVIAAAATGGILARIGFAVLLAVLGVTAALSLGGAIKLIGIGFLGRPRSLHAAAAEDITRGTFWGMGLLAVLCIPVALLPGLTLRALGESFPPLGYAPLPLAVLLALAGGAAFLALRRGAARGLREVPAWNGGFGRPPIWLPFGDPTTQPSATGFAQPVRRVLPVAVKTPSLAPFEHHAATLAKRVSEATARHGFALLSGALVLCLLAFGLAAA